MEACYGGTDVMERSCAVARGKDINIHLRPLHGGFRSETEKNLTAIYLTDISQLKKVPVRV